MVSCAYAPVILPTTKAVAASPPTALNTFPIVLCIAPVLAFIGCRAAPQGDVCKAYAKRECRGDSREEENCCATRHELDALPLGRRSLMLNRWARGVSSPELHNVGRSPYAL